MKGLYQVLSTKYQVQEPVPTLGIPSRDSVSRSEKRETRGEKREVRSERLAECTEFAEKSAMKNFELKEKNYDSAS